MNASQTTGDTDLDALIRKAVSEFAEAEQKFGEGDDHLVEAGKALLQARQLVRDGALGPDVRWEAWARQNIHISDSWRRQLIRIAEAKDPKAEAERNREATRERVQKHRERKRNKPSQTEPARLLLHDYVEGASIEMVKRLLLKEFNEIADTTKMVNKRMPKPKTPQSLALAA